MKATEQSRNNQSGYRTFAQACLGSCQKLLTQLAQVKNAMLAEFRDTFHTNEHLLRLALNEAEALAWETEFPQLVFPTLAAEKAQQIAAWSARQQAIQQNGSRFVSIA